MLYGSKKIVGQKEGLGGNLRYFRTDFVCGTPTDKNRRDLVEMATEIICIKEECFTHVKSGTNYKIFKNEAKYVAIIYDDDAIEPFKGHLSDLNVRCVVYVFSLDASDRSEEFENMSDMVDLRPFPTEILNTYRGIFK